MPITPASLRLIKAQRGESFAVLINDEPAPAFAGETVAAVLLAQGYRAFRRTPHGQLPRGLFCNQGICFDCLVTVDGTPNVRACMTAVRPDMVIQIEV